MKKILLLFLVILSNFSLVRASGGGSSPTVPCIDANPFCSSNTYNFVNSTNTSAPSGPDYGCLGSQPNPIWYYMQIGTSGTMQLTLVQTTGANGTGSQIDVDFALWGPFTDLSSGCSAITAGAASPIQCSFSTYGTETLGLGLPGGYSSGYSTPAAAVAGEYYIVILTNYDGSSGYISFNQTGGTGSADCNLVTATCNISNVTTSPSCPDASGLFNLSGQMTFANAPTTGTLVVTNSSGGSQTFSAPFTSPLSYSIAGITANGSTNTVTATFSDENSCTYTTSYTSPTVVPVNAGADQSVCAGSSVTLSGSGALSYSWNNSITNAVSFVPTSTTTYTVTGTDTYGCTATDQVVVTVNALPTVNAGSDVAVCPGNSTGLSASGASTYSWDNGLGTGANVTTSPTSTTTYTVTGTGGNGCVNTDDVVVSVYASPIINAGADVVICSGSNTVLSASGGVSYFWDNGLGAGNGVTVSPLSSTTYTVTGTDGNGCTASDAMIVTVNSLPVVDAGQDVSVCSGSFVTLTASGASIYFWDNGLGTGNGFSVSPVASTVYTVTGTSAAGCVATDQTTITVYTLPAVSAGTDISYCTGSSASLQASGAVSYSWSPASGLSVSNAANTVAATTTTTTYTVTGTDVNGCINSDQVVVTVYALPNVYAGANVAICEGQITTLVATGAVSYDWQPSTLGVGSAIQDVSPLVTTTYTVTGTSAEGCLNSDQVTVDVNLLPVANAGADTLLCTGNSVQLNATGGTSYSWQPTATLSTSVQASVNASPTQTTTYTVTVTSSEGCQSTDEVVVVVNSLPVINAGNDVVLCEGETYQLNASGGVDYSWGGGELNGVEVQPQVGQNTYTVAGTDANGCVNTDQVTVSVVQMPDASFTADSLIGYPVLDVNFSNYSSAATNFYWDFGNGQTQTTVGGASPFVSYSQPGTYLVTLTAYSGNCQDTSVIQIIVLPYPDPITNLPNVFTPNNDGTNDFFFIDTKFATDLHVVILNRWGDKIEELHGIGTKWDGLVNGKEASEGVYFFKYKIEGINGTTQVGHGDITLIR